MERRNFLTNCKSIEIKKGNIKMQLNISKQKRYNWLVAFTLSEGATHVAPCTNISTYFKFWCKAFPHVAHWKDSRKVAFTLAEVLITLGIIGVVAALTLPTLINNFQKNLAATRLKYYSSTMQQAAQMRSKDTIEGSFVDMNWDEVRAYNPDDMEKFYNHYWLPYVKTVSITKLSKGILVEYANGSGAYHQRNSVNTVGVSASSFIVFCPEYKYCKNVDVSNAHHNAVDGKHTFALWNRGIVPQEFKTYPYSRNELIELCKNDKYYCSSLIYLDGWQIKEDYPW